MAKVIAVSIDMYIYCSFNRSSFLFCLIRYALDSYQSGTRHIINGYSPIIWLLQPYVWNKCKSSVAFFSYSQIPLAHCQNYLGQPMQIILSFSFPISMAVYLYFILIKPNSSALCCTILSPIDVSLSHHVNFLTFSYHKVQGTLMSRNE